MSPTKRSSYTRKDGAPQSGDALTGAKDCSTRSYNVSRDHADLQMAGDKRQHAFKRAHLFSGTGRDGTIPEIVTLLFY